MLVDAATRALAGNTGDVNMVVQAMSQCVATLCQAGSIARNKLRENVPEVVLKAVLADLSGVSCDNLIALNQLFGGSVQVFQ